MSRHLAYLQEGSRPHQKFRELPIARRLLSPFDRSVPANDDSGDDWIDGAQNVSGETAEPAECVAFGPYRLLPKQRILFKADKPLRLGSRAMEILIALVEHSGQMISHGELMGLVWPDTYVEESNLRVHIASLRKVLGDGQNGIRYIVNSAGRGYTFVASLKRLNLNGTAAPATLAREHGNLPTRATRLIGRTEVVEATIRQLRQQRLVTIVGPGGIGKTTVALAVAEKMQEFHANGARFVDLSPVAEPRLVPSALASALGLSITSDDPTQSIVQFLSRRDMLIVLDTCEHVIEAAAILADALLKGTSGIHILATSREPLRAKGEWVRRLPPLAVPEQSSDLDANAVLGSPAVELFVERAQASLDSFSLTDRDVPLAAELCRRLDGLPLAIELAAGRVEQFGLAGLLARLDDRFMLLKEDLQTAQPRHRTLRATLDWSYDILSEQEQLVLRRVAPFKGEFTCESAAALIGRSDFSVSDVVECLASLAAKSLVAVNVSGEVATYKLPDVNRAYALDKLSESDDSRWIFQRHCETLLQSDANIGGLGHSNALHWRRL